MILLYNNISSLWSFSFAIITFCYIIITGMDAIKEYFFQNWILLLILGAFFVVLFISSFSNRRTTFRYLLLLVSIFLLSIVVFAEFYVQPVTENRIVRLILMSIRYSATPFVVALLIMVLVKKQSYLVFIPAALLLIINIVSIFTGIVFGLNEANELVRGPIGFLPYVMCGLYMALLIILLVMRSNKRWLEIVPIIFLTVALTSGLVFPFVFGSKFSQMYCTIMATSLFIYYVFTILELAKKDALTGVLNREAYYVETRRDYKDITAIISLDMNGLKGINDTYGHAAGDEALVTLALCFVKALKVRQSVYRMGGDEFVIVCRKTSEDEVKDLIKKIEENIAKTQYSCSIGYSYHEEGTVKLEDLLKESDKQMYSDKAEYYKNKTK